MPPLLPTRIPASGRSSLPLKPAALNAADVMLVSESSDAVPTDVPEVEMSMKGVELATIWICADAEPARPATAATPRPRIQREGRMCFMVVPILVGEDP